MRSCLGWILRGADAARQTLFAGVFDLVLGKLQTRHCYRFVFEQLAPGARVLDVGIGTGTYLPEAADLIREKQLKVVGVDIDADYLAWCDAAVRECGLAAHVKTVQEDVFQVGSLAEEQYDYVVLVTTWTVLPNRDELLPIVRDQLLRSGGALVIANAFYGRGLVTRLLNFVRVWVLGWIVGYGKCTHLDELSALLEASGYEVAVRRISYGLAARLVKTYAVFASVRAGSP